MNLLLDSNILIWFTLTPDRLSAKVFDLYPIDRVWE